MQNFSNALVSFNKCFNSSARVIFVFKCVCVCVQKAAGLKEEDEHEEEEEEELGHAETYVEYMPMKCKNKKCSN